MREERLLNLQNEEMLEVDGGRSLIPIVTGPVALPMGIIGAIVGAVSAATSNLIKIAK